jgi:hypothetical protein
MPTNHTRYVSAGKESTYNTPVAANAVGEVESESFQQSYDVLKRNDMNYYNAAKAIVSKKIAEGSISMALQPDKFVLMMLHGIMGNDTPSSDGGSAPSTDARTFDELTISSTDSLPSYTFRVGRDDKEHIFAGQVLESVSISASIGEYAMMTVNTVGAEQNSSTATLGTAVPSYTGDAAHFAKTFVRFEGEADTTAGGHSGLVQSIDFEIKTGRDMDNSYSLGSDTCIRAPPVTLREVTGSITFHKALLTGDASENEPFFDELMGATKANGQALSNPGSASPALSAFFVADADNYIRFDFFKVHFEMPETSVSGRDTQTMTVNFHGLYDLADANKVMQITCKSADALSNYDA